jgi:hypothetical protein
MHLGKKSRAFTMLRVGTESFGALDVQL